MSSFNGPKRPESHQIGDIAKGHVTDLFCSQGWVVDSTITDYGEDLLVQLIDKTALIPVRFYVQLKGTEDITKFEKEKHFSVPNLKQTSVVHWLNSETTIILILWDIKNKTGVYGFVDEIFRNLNANNQKSLSGNIQKESILNENTLDSFRADVVSNYCSKRYTTLLGINSLIESNPRYEEFFNQKKDIVRKDLIKVILFYLEQLKIIIYKNEDQFKINKEFRDFVTKEMQPLLKEINFDDEENLEKNVESALNGSIIGAHMMWRQEKFNIFTPGPLIDGSFFVLRELFEDLFQKAIKRYREMFPKD